MSTPSLPERLRHAASAPWPRADLLCAAAQRIEALTEALTEGRDCTRAAMQGYWARALDAERRVAELEDECRGLRERYAEAVERAWPEDESNGACEARIARLGIPELREELRDVAAWIAEHDGRAPEPAASEPHAGHPVGGRITTDGWGVLGRALDFALAAGSNYIEPEHIRQAVGR